MSKLITNRKSTKNLSDKTRFTLDSCQKQSQNYIKNYIFFFHSNFFFHLSRKVSFSKIINDTEPENNYVRVLDPKAAEISFVRTSCHTRQVLYVSCENLDCGIQSAVGQNQGILSKMSMPGDWPWYVALFRAETHVCDGTLVSEFLIDL